MDGWDIPDSETHVYSKTGGYIYKDDTVTSKTNFYYVNEGYDSSKTYGSWLTLSVNGSLSLTGLDFGNKNMVTFLKGDAKDILIYVPSTTNRASYWLSDKHKSFNNGYISCGYMNIYLGQIYLGNWNWNSSKQESATGNYFRPVVVLKRGVTFSKKNANGDWIIEL